MEKVLWGKRALFTCSRERKGSFSLPQQKEKASFTLPIPSQPCSLRSSVLKSCNLHWKIYILNLGSLHYPLSTASVWQSGKSDTKISLTWLIPLEACLWTDYLCPCIARGWCRVSKEGFYKVQAWRNLFLCLVDRAFITIFLGNSSKTFKFEINSTAKAVLSCLWRHAHSLQCRQLCVVLNTVKGEEASITFEESFLTPDLWENTFFRTWTPK